MIAGCIEPDNHLLGNQLIALAETAGGLAQIPFDETVTWQDDGVTLIQQTRWHNFRDNTAGEVTTHPETGIRIVGWMRLYNIEELKSCLAINSDRPVNDSYLVLSAYLKWGEELCQHIIGDFAFVLYDPRAQTCLLARDHMGVRPLYYYQDDRCFVFASSIAIIADLQGLDLGLSNEWLSGYLIDCSKYWNTTVYSRIHKLPAGHYAYYRSKRLHLHSYFDLTCTPQLSLKFDNDYVDTYRELLNQAVKCRVASDYGIAAESSGGLDSSTMVAFASANMAAPDTDLSCYGYVETPLEAQRILAVSNMANVHSTHLFSYHVSRKLQHRLEAEKYFLRYTGVIHEISTPIWHFPIYRMANKNGARILLSGFGGDEFVTSQANLAKFDLFDQGKYRLWVSRHRGSAIGQTMRALKTLRSIHLLSRQMRSAEQYSQQPSQTKLSGNFLRDCIYEEFELRKRQLERLNRGQTDNSINALIFRDLWGAANIHRLESCTLAAAGHGLEYRWPLLDIRLIKFFLSIPPEQKLGPKGITRYLHRRAVRGMIPDEIGDKTSMGPPYPVKNESMPDRFIYTKNSRVLDPERLSSPLQELIDGSRLENLLAKYNANPTAANTRPCFNRLYRLNQWLKR
jgi:asparagine synthase (glutamine-hydrolysing)